MEVPIETNVFWHSIVSQLIQGLEFFRKTFKSNEIRELTKSFLFWKLVLNIFPTLNDNYKILFNALGEITLRSDLLKNSDY